MQAKELFEKIHFKFDSPYTNEEVKVFKNPSHLEFLNALKMSSYNELRGLTNGNATYIWDANLATHDDVLKLIVEQNNPMKFIIISSNELISADDEFSKEDILKIDTIKRMLNT